MNQPAYIFSKMFIAVWMVVKMSSPQALDSVVYSHDLALSAGKFLFSQTCVDVRQLDVHGRYFRLRFFQVFQQRASRGEFALFGENCRRIKPNMGVVCAAGPVKADYD